MSPIDDFSLSWEFAIANANIRFFQSSLLARSKELFLSIRQQKKRFREDFQLEDLFIHYTIRGEDAFRDCVRSGPVIFVCFHLGPIAPLLAYISNHEIDITLLLDQSYFEKGAAHYDSIYHRYTEKRSLDHSFSILNAETKQAGARIASAIRQGSSLLLFVDGNTGVGGISRQDSRLCAVDFLGKKIFARNGVAYFSKLFNMPVVPAVTYFENSGDQVNYFLEFCAPVFPGKEMSKEQAAADVTRQLFSTLEKYVLKYPDQWEGWLYFHHFIDKGQLPAEEMQVEPGDALLPLRFASHRCSFFFHDGSYYLLNQLNYRHYAISNDVYKLLSNLREPQVIDKIISTDSIVQLLKRGILTKEI